MDTTGFRMNMDEMFPKEPDFFASEELCMRDYEYMKHLYPKEVQLVSSVVEEYIDRFEYEGSPIYAQYPDAVTVYRISGEICNQMSWKDNNEENEQWKRMIQIMVCQEMYVRRRRHDRFCQKFQNCNWKNIRN